MPKLSTFGVESNNLFFTDDAAIHGEDAEEAQALLDVCSEWGVEYGTFNKKENGCYFVVSNGHIQGATT
jgi:hypothetical protein